MSNKEKDDVAFLQFLANDYGEMLKDISPRKYSFFQRDKERDIAPNFRYWTSCF